MVHVKAGRSLVRKTDPHRAERIACQHAQRAQSDTCRLLDSLAPDPVMTLHLHTHMQQHQVAHVFKSQLHSGVMQPHVACARLQGCAQCRLFANEQRQHAEVGQLSRLREQQSESLLAGQTGRLLQQPPHRVGADHDIRIVEDTGRQPGQAQHAKWIEPH
ncbi:hypothetical protein D3C81_1319750 [compost metagenome]